MLMPRQPVPALQVPTLAHGPFTLADDAAIPLSQLAIRFVLSMPAVDFVLAGAARPAEWEDTRLAYEAGPLPTDLYRQVWANAQRGLEPDTGG